MGELKTDDIKSYAFLDLETTGLPELECFKTKITELSIVACSKAHLLETQKDSEHTKGLPRVLHKLTLCFNPFKRIQLRSSDVTHLTNDLLEFENKFNEDSIKLIELFLSQLQQPVCLIAHNGDGFDFPILKKQFQKFGSTCLDKYYCCDSLAVFRKLESDKLNLEKYKMSEWNEVQETSNDSLLVQNELDSDETVASFIKKELEEIEEEESKEEASKFAPFIYRTPSSRNITNGTEKSEKEPSDLEKRKILNETTPAKGISKNNLLNGPHKAVAPENPRKEPTASKRKLFSDQKFNRNFQKGHFTLGGIFFRYYGSNPPQDHHAENDVINLIKCAIACKSDFVNLTDLLARKFEDVNALQGF